VREKVLDVESLGRDESPTVTLATPEPLLLGVPDTIPVELSVSPKGMVPDQVYGGTPPRAVKAAE
jgi:hypothetical protein